MTDLRPRSWRPRAIASLTMLALLTSSPASGQDWPQWRGPNRDGVLRSEVPLIKELPPKSLPREWTVPVGAGYSGPTVADGRIYLTDRQAQSDESGSERVLCFDAATGRELWSFSYPVAYAISYTAGPRASVTVHDGRAIAVGAMGHMHCLDAASGDLLWKQDLAAEFDVQMPIWGIAGAPLVYKDLVIQIVSGADGACVVALELSNGQERWRALDERAGYSAPILIRQGDADVVVCWTGESVSGLNPDTGEVHWAVPMLPRNMPIGVATPITDGSRLFVSSFYDGSLMIALDADEPEAKQLWHRVGVDEKNTDALHSIIATPIFKGDYLYGVDSYGELRCLKASNGDRVWENQTAVPRNRWATIHIIQSADREILLNDQGELIFATLAPEGYIEHSRTQLIAPTRLQLNRRNGVTWAHPAIADGMIYARSDEELICASLRAEGKSK